jgi:hypothetical protein
MIIMAYAGLTIETTVSSATLDSHCIPAYPQYNTSTTFNGAFYTARKASNDTLAGTTITYKVQT